MTLSSETRTRILATKKGKPSGAKGRLWPTSSRLKISLDRRGQIGRKRKRASSKYVGVCWDKDRNLYSTQIRISGKDVRAGRHVDEIAAAMAVDVALMNAGR